MNVWGLVKKVTVKYLAIYIGVAVVVDRLILYLAETLGVLPLFPVWDASTLIETTIGIAVVWFFIRIFVEIRQG
ncbi:hypothetical protein EXS57_02325 [Candidatus Kaiserbacteria bacterium]|nr:hypothetical protein [Candidatus Kaiserbacteria bacterium]